MLGAHRERPRGGKLKEPRAGAAFGPRRKQHDPAAPRLSADLRCSGIAFRGELTRAISQRPGARPEPAGAGGAGRGWRRPARVEGESRGSRVEGRGSDGPASEGGQGQTPHFPRAEPQHCPATAQARPLPPPLLRRRNSATAQAPLSGSPRGSPPRCDPLTPLSPRGHGGGQGPLGTPAGGSRLYVRAGARSAAAAAHWASARPARGLPRLRAAAGGQGRAGECAPAGTGAGRRGRAPPAPSPIRNTLSLPNPTPRGPPRVDSRDPRSPAGAVRVRSLRRHGAPRGLGVSPPDSALGRGCLLPTRSIDREEPLPFIKTGVIDRTQGGAGGDVLNYTCKMRDTT